jgi:DNA-binding NtrC family response regulator
VLAGDGEEGGTTYELLLPLVAGGRPVPEVVSAVEPAAGPAKPTVLLVEDEDLIRHLAEQILVEAGYRVLTAANASEAMEIAERASERLDLLLTDVVMPGVSGTDLAHRLLRHHPEMRILYMSGYSDSLIFRYGVLQERAAFLRKPFSAEALERRVGELLGRAG